MAKQYQIYGIGNALVDFEIETEKSKLESLGVDKGVMTLIDEDRQTELFASFDGNKHHRACGGSAANTIIGAQSLGVKCFYSCKVANDETGQFYRDDLASHGVDSNLTGEALEEGKTGKCLVLVTEDADRTLNTFLGITVNIGYDQVDEQALLNSQILYVEGYLAGSPTAYVEAEKAISFAKTNGVKTAFSLSDPNMVNFCREGLDVMIGNGVDILFCNRDEALSFSDSATVEDAIVKLKNIANTVVVTQGADGVVISTNDHSSEVSNGGGNNEASNIIQIEGFNVEAVDTNGAGDLFAGSFLAAIGQGASPENAATIACYASSRLVTQFGPRLNAENLEDVLRFQEKYLG